MKVNNGSRNRQINGSRNQSFSTVSQPRSIGRSTRTPAVPGTSGNRFPDNREPCTPLKGVLVPSPGPEGPQSFQPAEIDEPDEPCLTRDGWYRLKGYSATADTLTAGTPWYSDEPPDITDNGDCVSPFATRPGYLPDTGRPNALDRAAIAGRWR